MTLRLQAILAAALVLGITAAAQAAKPVPPPTLVITWPGPDRSNPNERSAAQALRDVARARSQITRACVELRRTTESSAEWQQAIADLRQARTAYEAVRAGALVELRGSTAYRSAGIELWKMQESLEAVRADRKAPPGRIVEMSRQILRHRTMLSMLEAEALSGNDQVSEARDALIDAEAKVSALRKQFAESIRVDPCWRSARQQLETARHRLASISS